MVLLREPRAAAVLADLFGVPVADVAVGADVVQIGDHAFPVVDDVVVLLPPEQRSPALARRMGQAQTASSTSEFATDIQATFGAEWQRYGTILPEHRDEFDRYFDLVDVAALADGRVMDLGCGMGRFSSFLTQRCREVVLVDFSDAIFVARKNLDGADNALFFLGNVLDLPFRDDAADLAFSLGVLHHLPVDCLVATRRLARLAPQLLVFLYYALDNRPPHYRALLRLVTAARLQLSKIEDDRVRGALSVAGTHGLYKPMVRLGRVLDIVGLGTHVPLYDFYKDRSDARIEQDVYDRFFTRIEQRVSRKQIASLVDAFDDVVISDQLPYWHFLCRRRPRTPSP